MSSRTDTDFRVHDGYVKFSSEIVRLALLSPTVFLLLVGIAGENVSREYYLALLKPGLKTLAFGLVFMSLAIVFGFAHRYFAMDFMSNLIETYRGKDRKTELEVLKWLNLATIILAPISLVIGASCMFVALFRILGG